MTTNTDEADLVLSTEELAANPDLVSAALSLSEQEAPPALQDPLDGPVQLTAGFRRVTTSSGDTALEEVKTAWVRELTGDDEERISKVRMKEDTNGFIRTILECGVEKLGDQNPSKDDFNSLVLGDRDLLLLEIARATYGDQLEYEKVVCTSCGEEFGVSLSISEDVPVTRLKDDSERTFEVPLKRGRVATVSLPTMEVDAELARTETPASSNTLLIAHFVDHITDAKGDVQTIQGDKDAAKRLGVMDRQALVTAMADRMPGPKYNEVRFNHEPGCGEEIRLQILLADLFRGL